MRLKLILIFTITLLSIFYRPQDAFSFKETINKNIENIRESTTKIYEDLRKKSPAYNIFNHWLNYKERANNAIQTAYNNMANIYSPNEYNLALRSLDKAYHYAEKRFYKRAIDFAILTERYAKIANKNSLDYIHSQKEKFQSDIEYIYKNLNCMDKNIQIKDESQRKYLNELIFNYSYIINSYRLYNFEAISENITQLKASIENSIYKCREKN